MNPTGEDMGYLLSQTTRCLRAELVEGLHNHGLDDADYIVLFFAHQSGDEGVTTRAVSEILQMPAPALDAAAGRLVRAGWLTASPVPGGMAQLLRLTPKAASVVPVLGDVAHWAIERALSGFTDDEIANLTDYLKRMQANLR